METLHEEMSVIYSNGVVSGYSKQFLGIRKPRLYTTSIKVVCLYLPNQQPVPCQHEFG